MILTNKLIKKSLFFKTTLILLYLNHNLDLKKTYNCNKKFKYCLKTLNYAFLFLLFLVLLQL